MSRSFEACSACTDPTACEAVVENVQATAKSVPELREKWQGILPATSVEDTANRITQEYSEAVAALQGLGCSHTDATIRQMIATGI